MGEPREFDAEAIARHLASGDRVQLGEHLIMETEGGDYTARCMRCEAEQRIPLARRTVLFEMDRMATFLIKHAHQELSS